MSGYREHGYDPNHSRPAQLLRPFDSWQWVGVALAAIGFMLLLVEIFDPFGGYNPTFEGPLMLVGAGLIYWRDPELPAGSLGTRRRFVLIALLVAAAISAIAALIDLQGA